MYRFWGRASTLLAIITLLFYFFSLKSVLEAVRSSSTQFVDSQPYLRGYSSPKWHPVEFLVQESELRFQRKLERQSKSLNEAVIEYKRRFGREPPPKFDVWYNLSLQHNSMFVDDTYDGILEGVDPFLKLSANDIRKRVEAVINSKEWIVPFEIKAHKSMEVKHNWRWDLIGDWLEKYAKHLPDMKIPYDILPEPRVAVPWDRMPANSKCPEGLTFQSLEEFKFLNLNHLRPWGHAVRACPPESPARANEDDLGGLEKTLPLVDNEPVVAPKYLRFVRGVAAAKDICENPEAETQHGLLVSPDTMRLTVDLLPIFSRDKLSSFQDILVPTPAYGEGSTNDKGEMPWEHKRNDLYWVGTTTGGYHHNGSWKFTQRFRFVSFLNNGSRPITLLGQKDAKSWEAYQSTIAQISHLVNVKFTSHKLCADADCTAQKQDPTIRFGKPENPGDFKGHRLVIDIDGQASTDRFYKLLRSNSTVLKQTLCQEWHDGRLMPWIHYVPISMHMEELPEIIRFLTEEEAGRRIAKNIAIQGRHFAASALRDVDMGLYFFRLLLEWARVIDPRRDEQLPLCELS